MRIVTNLVQGPFKDEQEFKYTVLKAWKKGSLTQSFFEIENEEKEPGMPDVLVMSTDHPAYFTEFKYANKKGVIEFKKSQPLFYKQHFDLRIQILVWDSRKEGRVILISPGEVITMRSLRITIPERVKNSLPYISEKSLQEGNEVGEGSDND